MAHNDSFDEPRFEALYRKLYPDLLRCAEIALRTGGSWYVSVAGRAEEVVQELFAFAWEHQADLWSSASPTGWLYRVLRYKVLELLKAGAGDGVEEVRPGHAGQAFKGAVRQTVEPALKVFSPPL